MELEIIPVTAFEQNCSLLWDAQSREAVVVDPGGDPARIEAAIAEAGVTLSAILVTHAHLDHVGAVADLADRFKVEIIGPQREDQFWIDALPAQAELFGFPPARQFTPDRWLEDGDTFEAAGTNWLVRHCPGHTPGHVVFYSAAERLAFVGDVLFAGSIGRTDFPRGDLNTLLDSIRNKLFPLGDEVRFVPGHGPMSTFGEERRHNPFLRQ